ncbi:MAG TPA: hypothetical protein VGS16_13710 [Candidatus Dormibacteraeota bacterium]|nr:hypothetical protein [Candidatus Dormibacteraeota bacterium]
MIDLEQRQRIPEYRSREHMEWLAKRLSRNLRFRRLYGDRERRPAIAERDE